VENEQMLGFGCYEATCKDFFGPTGVLESTRGRGIGKALLIACLHALREMGYGYAVIGGAGPTQFYEKTVGAVIIPDSTPGVYRGLLKR
jgi:GNAT superfamily N-acetyltransferase